MSHTIHSRTSQRSTHLSWLAMTLVLGTVLMLVFVANAHAQVATSSTSTSAVITPSLSLFSTLDTPDASPFVPCGLYKSTSELPFGYGSPYYVVSNPASLLVQVGCNKTNVALGAGTGALNQYVYNRGYVFNYDRWQPVSLVGPVPRESGTWFQGSAAGTTYIGEKEMRRLRWAVAYVCSYDATTSAWKCGCRDAACTTSSWQIQMFAHY